jgi:hypothetical protein
MSADPVKLAQQEVISLLEQEAYAVADLEQALSHYHSALDLSLEKVIEPQQRESLLADNLQWITLVTELVQAERSAIAAMMLQLQKGKKAHKSYSDYN